MRADFGLTHGSKGVWYQTVTRVIERRFQSCLSNGKCNLCRYTSAHAAPPALGYAARGPFDGGTEITVRGTVFLQSSHLSCRFQDSASGLPPVEVPAKWIDGTTATCVTPRRSPRLKTRGSRGAVAASMDSRDIGAAAPAGRVEPAQGSGEGRTSSRKGGGGGGGEDDEAWRVAGSIPDGGYVDADDDSTAATSSPPSLDIVYAAKDIATLAPCFVADVFLSNDGAAFSARHPGGVYLYCDVYVSPGASDPAEAAGTPDRPFPDVQSALNAALRGARVRDPAGESRFAGEAAAGPLAGAGVGGGGAGNDKRGWSSHVL